MKLKEGKNEEYQKVRDGLPEPFYHKGERIIGLLPIEPTVFFYLPEVVDISYVDKNRVHFESITIHSPGIVFQAWVCKEDGCIYF